MQQIYWHGGSTLLYFIRSIISETQALGTKFNKHHFQKPKSHKISFYVIKSRREKSKLHKFIMGTLVILSLSFFHLRYVSLILTRSKIVSISLIMERRKYQLVMTMGIPIYTRLHRDGHRKRVLIRVQRRKTTRF